jgi:Ca2+-binding EF-hand superfamily protein
VNQFISAIDKNGDGKIAKAELFDILKQLINNG